MKRGKHLLIFKAHFVLRLVHSFRCGRDGKSFERNSFGC